MEAVRRRSTTKIRGWEGSKVEMGGGEREGTTVIYYVMHAKKKDGLGSGGSRGQSASSKMLSCKEVCG